MELVGLLFPGWRIKWNIRRVNVTGTETKMESVGLLSLIAWTIIGLRISTKRQRDPPIWLIGFYILFFIWYCSSPGYSSINNSLEFDIGVWVFEKIVILY